MLCMGRRVELDLKSGRTVIAPRRAAMLYDATGAAWPKCSLLIARFDGWLEEPTDDEQSEGEDYFGRDVDIGIGEIDLPPKDMAKWRRVGEVKTLFYDRAGSKAPGFFRHEFHKPRGLWKAIFKVWGIFSKKIKEPVVLYSLREFRSTAHKAWRIELPTCIVDDRGVAAP